MRWLVSRTSVTERRPRIPGSASRYCVSGQTCRTATAGRRFAATGGGAYDALRSLSDLYHDETEPITGGLDPGRIAGGLRQAGVRFAYPGTEHRVLNDLHLVVPAGTPVALVRPSGGGKRTIARLVLGFYHAEQGAVTVDGHNVHALDLSALRR